LRIRLQPALGSLAKSITTRLKKSLAIAALYRKFKQPFFLIGAISPARRLVNVFLVDENPDVASAGSGGAAVGGARSVPDHAARSNSERAAPSAHVGNRFSAPQIVWNRSIAAPASWVTAK
jgi:hypothetical protein